MVLPWVAHFGGFGIVSNPRAGCHVIHVAFVFRQYEDIVVGGGSRSPIGVTRKCSFCNDIRTRRINYSVPLRSKIT